MKKIDTSAHIGDSGIALIHQMVNKMGFVWYERKLDAGIDGEIELRDPSTGEVANRLILVQSKASERLFPGENDRTFHFQCKQPDVDYWMAAQDPVLLVCSHPHTGEAWWTHIQTWFADPARRASGRVDFDKRVQRFDANAASRLLNLADPHGHAHVPVAEHRDELLTTNLLQVTIPALLYSAPAKYSDARGVLAHQRTDDMADLRHDFILRGGKIYTWLPPEETALRDVVSGRTDVISTQEWTTDPDRQRWLVHLLNLALQRDVAPDCDWHSGRRIVYFRATKDLAVRSIRSANGRSHLVFHPKPKQHAPDEVGYCKHAALEWRFLVFDGEWYCALTPTYHYTRDGVRDSFYMSEYLTGIKQRERNSSVYGKVRLWASYLHGEDGVINPQETILDYGELVTYTADRAIDDEAWLFDPRAPQEANVGNGDKDEAIDDPTDEMALFEVEL